MNEVFLKPDTTKKTSLLNGDTVLLLFVIFALGVACGGCFVAYQLMRYLFAA